jgi:hypothetical protein
LIQKRAARVFPSAAQSVVPLMRGIAIIVFQAGALAIYHRPEAVKAQLVNIMPSDLPL